MYRIRNYRVQFTKGAANAAQLVHKNPVTLGPLSQRTMIVSANYAEINKSKQQCTEVANEMWATTFRKFQM